MLRPASFFSGGTRQLRADGVRKKEVNMILQQVFRIALVIGLIGVPAAQAIAADNPYHRVVDGVSVYFGIVPADLVREHPAKHPERTMHGGPPQGDIHLVVALFDDKTGKRLDNAFVQAHVTGDARLDIRKPLEPMTVAGAASYGNYFYLTGEGPYRIQLDITVPGRAKPVRVAFRWARS